MKKFARALSLMLAIVFLAVSFAGCSQKETKIENPVDNVEASSSSEPVETTTSTEKTEVTFWHVYSENFGATVIQEFIDDFNASQDKIVVTGVYNPDMYPGLMTNLQAEVTSGSYPSICMIGYNYLNYFAGNFEYTDIKDIDRDGWLNSTFLPNILTLAQADGSQLGVPMSISTPILYYNADLFNAAGIESAPTTWEQVKEYSLKIKEATGKYGFYMQEYADNWAVQGLLESNGARMLTDGVATFASEEAAEAYQVLADMVLQDKSALHVAADEGIAAFTSGEVGMLLGTSAKIGTISKAAGFNLNATKFPSFGNKDIRIPAGGNFLALTAQDEVEQQAAFEFIKFIMQPENLSKWSAGMGYLPPREDVSETLSKQLTEGTIANLWQVAFSELGYIYSWVSYPGDVGTFAEQLFANTRDVILSGEKAPMEALKDAQDQLNARLGN